MIVVLHYQPSLYASIFGKTCRESLNATPNFVFYECGFSMRKQISEMWISLLGFCEHCMFIRVSSDSSHRPQRGDVCPALSGEDHRPTRLHYHSRRAARRGTQRHPHHHRLPQVHLLHRQVFYTSMQIERGHVSLSLYVPMYVIKYKSFSNYQKLLTHN